MQDTQDTQDTKRINIYNKTSYENAITRHKQDTNKTQNNENLDNINVSRRKIVTQDTQDTKRKA